MRRALAVVIRVLSVEFVFVTSLQFPPDHAAAAKARRFISDTMRSWGYDDSVADAQLLVSELVTNAVLHARSATRVTVERNGRTLRVSVFDRNPARPRLRELGPEAVTGRGLLLVDRIAQRRGVDTNDEGKCVWFEVEAEVEADGRERGG